MHHRRFGKLLREFIFGHARQLESVLRELLVTLRGQAELLPDADNRLLVNIRSLRAGVRACQAGRLLRRSYVGRNG